MTRSWSDYFEICRHPPSQSSRDGKDDQRPPASPPRDAAKHLQWMRDKLDDLFLHGVVFHTGRRSFELDDRITALPLCAFWQ
ncbi:MAG: hypothetical protein ACREN8_02495 [Candidatus Dormibacteraceae bacterium]